MENIVPDENTETGEQTSYNNDYKTSPWYLELMGDIKQSPDEANNNETPINDYSTINPVNNIEQDNYVEDIVPAESTEIGEQTSYNNDYKTSPWYLELMGDIKQIPDEANNNETPINDYSTINPVNNIEQDNYVEDIVPAESTEIGEQTSYNNDYKTSPWYLELMGDNKESSTTDISFIDYNSTNSVDNIEQDNYLDKIVTVENPEFGDQTNYDNDFKTSQWFLELKDKQSTDVIDRNDIQIVRIPEPPHEISIPIENMTSVESKENGFDSAVQVNFVYLYFNFLIY